MNKTILVTGGLGYIGSHTVVELLNKKYNVIIADNLCNSEITVLNKIEQITAQKPLFKQVELCNLQETEKLFTENKIDIVIHFAALKSVNESNEQPLRYFFNNMVSLMHVLMSMEKYNTGYFIYSSSATVYGQPDRLPVTEESPIKKSLSAYGSTKQMGEEMLEKVSANKKIKSVSLRYFNPVGAHTSGLIGEKPKGIPNNLMPFITQTAIGKRKTLTVFGNNYSTKDGTCIRDFIHVVDLANAHIKAMEYLLNEEKKDHFNVFNVGTGTGYTVMELIKAFENINHVNLNYQIGSKRSGDVESIYANVEKANKELGWKARYDLADMVSTAWNWEKNIQ